MQNFSLLKREFLKKWIEGLRECNSATKDMGIMERKSAIKLTADLAMASARRGRTYWSRAIIAKASQGQQSNRDGLRNHAMAEKASKQRRFRSEKITKRSQSFRRASSRKTLPVSMAKKSVKKRTRVLKSLVPGGQQCLDEVSLIRETLDYVMSLQAQVDVMRSCLVGTAELADDK